MKNISKFIFDGHYINRKRIFIIMSVLLTTALVLGLNGKPANQVQKTDTIQNSTHLMLQKRDAVDLTCKPDRLFINKGFIDKEMCDEGLREKQRQKMLAQIKLVDYILDFFVPKVEKPHLDLDVSQSVYKGPAWYLDRFLGDGKLKGKGDLFLEAQKKYGINATFLIAIADIESACGESNLAKNNNNFGGMKGKKGWLKFDTVEEGIDSLASNLKRRYIDDGLTTISQINKRYAENPNWGSAIVGKMDKMYKQFHIK